MRKPQQNDKNGKVLNPVKDSNFLGYIFQLYEKIHSYDSTYSSYLFSITQKCTPLAIFCKAFALFTDGPALPLFIFIYGYTHQVAPLTYVAYILFFILVHEFTIKRIFRRHRPDTAGTKTGFSFPSSHSFTSGIIIVTCLFFPLPYAWLIILAALFNMINRVLVGVHYLSDVVVGWFLGTLVGLGWVLLLPYAQFLP